MYRASDSQILAVTSRQLLEELTQGADPLMATPGEGDRRGMTSNPTSPTDSGKGPPPESSPAASDIQAQETTETAVPPSQPPSNLASIMLGEPKGNIPSHRSFGKAVTNRPYHDGDLNRHGNAERSESGVETMRALLMGHCSSEHLYSKDQLRQLTRSPASNRSKPPTPQGSPAPEGDQASQDRKMQQQRLKQRIQLQVQLKKQQQQKETPSKIYPPQPANLLTSPEQPQVHVEHMPMEIDSDAGVASNPPAMSPPQTTVAPISAYLHPSYDSMLTSMQARMDLESSMNVSALPLPEATLNSLIQNGHGSEYQPSVKKSQAASYTQHSDSEVDFTQLNLSPAKRRCLSPIQPYQQQQSPLAQERRSPVSNKRDGTSSQSTRQKRFLRTRQALEKSGLLGITMKTAALMNENKALDKEIEQLKQDTELLMRSIFNQDQQRQQQQQQQNDVQSQGYLLAKYASIFMTGMERL